MSTMTAAEIRQQFALDTSGPVPLMVTAPVAPAIPAVTIDQVIATVTEEVTVRPVVATERGTQSTHLAEAGKDWTWRELRDYVVGKIEAQFGLFPRDDHKETGIFKSFMSRYPHGKAAEIARHAFEVKGGYWKGAPISVTRFCKGSDPYFAEPILQYLANIAAQ